MIVDPQDKLKATAVGYQKLAIALRQVSFLVMQWSQPTIMCIYEEMGASTIIPNACIMDPGVVLDQAWCSLPRTRNWGIK